MNINKLTIQISVLEAEHIYNVLRTIKDDPSVIRDVTDDLDSALEIIEELLRL